MNKLQYLNYLRNLSIGSELNCFILPWGSAIIRNCDESGELYSPATLKDYRVHVKCMWVLLKAAVFRDQLGVYGVLCCQDRGCGSMQGILELSVDQNREDLQQRLCHHNKAIAFHIPDWEIKLCLSKEIDGERVSQFRNGGIKIKILRNALTDDLFLALYQQNEVLSILHTINKASQVPLCSQCSRKPCPCLAKLKSKQQDPHGLNEKSQEDQLSEEQGSSGLKRPIEEEGEEDFPWTRKRAKKEKVEHYEEELSLHQYYEEYGFNRKKILYPIKRDPNRQNEWLRRLEGGEPSFPAERIVADMEEGLECSRHGNLFSQEEKYLVKTSSSVTVYGVDSEKTFPVKTYARGTRSCTCLFHVDGDKFQLFHVKPGKFLDYIYLNRYLLRHLANGTAVNAEFESRSMALGSIGISSTLRFQDLLQGITGFRILLSFPKNIFICPDCTEHPQYLGFDGTDMGPTKVSVAHLSELNHPGGEEVLSQGSLFENRTYLASYQERELVKNLLTEVLDIDDFLDAELTSAGGRQIHLLVQRLHESHGSIPLEYKRLLTNIAKETPVCGLLQVTQPKPLSLLKNFARGLLDLSNLENIDSLNLVKSELPPFWDILSNILKLEQVSFLPQDVADIVLRLLVVRNYTFRGAAVRSSRDYTTWDEPRDHPTQCYPDLPLRQYPKRYQVTSRADHDRCLKETRENRTFVEGIFTVGCTCKKNITMGFELMMHPESPHNPFRFLMCRNLDLNPDSPTRLRGIFWDNGCNLHKYLLNREPREFEFLRVLVDGSHWRGHKTLKKGNKSGKGGHLGCSEGYNYNLYRDFLPAGHHSQGREEMHSILTMAKKSVRQLSYRNAMVTLRTFFSLLNLKRRGDL